MNQFINLINSLIELLKELASYFNLLIGFLFGLISFLITSNPRFLNKLRKQVRISIDEASPTYQQSNMIKLRITYELGNASNDSARFNFMFLEFDNDQISGNTHYNEPTLFELINPTSGRWYLSSEAINCESDSIVRKSLIITNNGLLSSINTIKPKKFRLVIQGAKFGKIKSKWEKILYM